MGRGDNSAEVEAPVLSKDQPISETTSQVLHSVLATTTKDAMSFDEIQEQYQHVYGEISYGELRAELGKLIKEDAVMASDRQDDHYFARTGHSFAEENVPDPGLRAQMRLHLSGLQSGDWKERAKDAELTIESLSDVVNDPDSELSAEQKLEQVQKYIKGWRHDNLIQILEQEEIQRAADHHNKPFDQTAVYSVINGYADPVPFEVVQQGLEEEVGLDYSKEKIEQLLEQLVEQGEVQLKEQDLYFVDEIS